MSRRLVHLFMSSDLAAAGARPMYAIGASERAVRSTLGDVAGSRSTRAGFQKSMQEQNADVATTASVVNPAGTYAPNTDCDEWVNNDGRQPTVPQNGQLRQVRMQGVVESTEHTLWAFGKTGYPAILHHVAMTQGHGGHIKPVYGYEHNYKVTNNGYVQTKSDYEWSTNLPGAYRDTRASDSGTSLDFTIGSMFTWLLDSSKTYQVRTSVPSTTNGTPLSSTATLTAQVLPNDGDFSAATAAAGNGCEFVLDPSNGNTTPANNTQNYAWCTGIGGGLGSEKARYPYISTTAFPIKYTGTCRDWTLNKGAVAC